MSQAKLTYSVHLPQPSVALHVEAESSNPIHIRASLVQELLRGLRSPLPERGSVTIRWERVRTPPEAPSEV